MWFCTTQHGRARVVFFFFFYGAKKDARAEVSLHARRVHDRERERFFLVSRNEEEGRSEMNSGLFSPRRSPFVFAPGNEVKSMCG
jgi:hypothetical protein